MKAAITRTKRLIRASLQSNRPIVFVYFTYSLSVLGHGDYRDKSKFVYMIRNEQLSGCRNTFQVLVEIQ